jgi:hypothetical protein
MNRYIFDSRRVKQLRKFKQLKTLYLLDCKWAPNLDGTKVHSVQEEEGRGIIERRVASHLSRPNQSSLRELRALLEKVDCTARFSLGYIATVLGTGEISYNTVLESFAIDTFAQMHKLSALFKINRDPSGGASGYCMEMVKENVAGN